MDGIPVGRMVSDEINTSEMDQEIARRVVRPGPCSAGNCGAYSNIASEPDGPGSAIGVFFLVGPSGVGKTETANYSG